jgi:hypothetical protein
MASIVGTTLALSACSGGQDELSASGPIRGAAPADAELVVIWMINSGGPDHSYKFGDGSVAGTRFTVGLSSDPPPEAINTYGMGVGVVVLLEPGATIPEGRVDEEVLEAAALGFSEQHAIIWRDPSRPGLPWSADFPEGMSCGQCVPAASGFDSFKPMECSAVEVQVPSDVTTLEFCNWT